MVIAAVVTLARILVPVLYRMLTYRMLTAYLYRMLTFLTVAFKQQERRKVLRASLLNTSADY